MSIVLDSKVPKGDLASKWTDYRSTMNLVAPNNKRRIEIIVVVPNSLSLRILNISTISKGSSSISYAGAINLCSGNFKVK